MCFSLDFVGNLVDSAGWLLRLTETSDLHLVYVSRSVCHGPEAGQAERTPSNLSARASMAFALGELLAVLNRDR